MEITSIGASVISSSFVGDDVLEIQIACQDGGLLVVQVVDKSAFPPIPDLSVNALSIQVSSNGSVKLTTRCGSIDAIEGCGN